MPRISLICVWNNRELIERTLLPSVDADRLGIETILLDNRNGTYPSAAAALNAGAERATGEYFAFVHQDVAFASADELRRAVDLIAGLPHCGVAGPAGAVRKVRGRTGGSQMFGQIRQGLPPGILTPFNPVTAPKPVATLDELLLIIPRAVFQQTRFDPIACPGWHLYGVEYCLNIAKRKLQPYVVPINLHHLSGGTLNEDYYRTLGTVCRKHMGLGVIATTCGNWLTVIPPRWQRDAKRFLASRR